MKATARAVVNRPIEDVWTYVSTVESIENWVDGVRDIHRSDTGELAVGSRFPATYTYRGKSFDVEFEVTAYDLPDRLDMTWIDGPFPFDGSLRPDQADGGPLVSNTVDVGSDSPATSVIFAVFGPRIRRLMRRQLVGELERLARAFGAVGEETGASEETDT